MAKTSTTTHPDHPTWRTLGDVGRLDDEGYLYLTDRLAFMIVAGGVNIYPQEIEDVLLAHPDVLDAARVRRAECRDGRRGKGGDPARGLAGGR